MELHEQIDAVQRLIDRLANAAAVSAKEAAATQAGVNAAGTPRADVEAANAATSGTESASRTEPPQLHFHRPTQNEIVISLGEHAVKLGPADVSAIIEELAIARASMTPEPPTGLPSGWRFAATQDPVIASQPRNDGSKLIVFRHTGYGWVPFTFTPKMIVELFAVLSAK
jgi:hypothetical protein